jgi:hypothetical protein
LFESSTWLSVSEKGKYRLILPALSIMDAHIHNQSARAKVTLQLWDTLLAC